MARIPIPDIPADFPIVPPEWEPPHPGPYTGWLSPSGVLYACNPWCHATLAGELTAHGRRACPDFRYHSGGDILVKLGWLLIDRPHKSDRNGGGGGLYVVRHGQPNDAQAETLLRWAEMAGVRVEQETNREAGR